MDPARNLGRHQRQGPEVPSPHLSLAVHISDGFFQKSRGIAVERWALLFVGRSGLLSLREEWFRIWRVLGMVSIFMQKALVGKVRIWRLLLIPKFPIPMNILSIYVPTLQD